MEVGGCGSLYSIKPWPYIVSLHDDVIKWKHFPRYWPFVWGIHRSPVNSPHKRPVTRSFDVFFDMRLNKRLSKQSWGWWFETPLRSWWRYCNVRETMFALHVSWRMVSSKPSNHLNQRWLMSVSFSSKYQWKIHQDANIFFQGNAFDIVVASMPTAVSMSQCVGYIIKMTS